MTEEIAAQFEALAEYTISNAKALPVSCEDFVDGLAIVIESLNARWIDAKGELRSSL